jgi:signal transduction histidine kinase
LNTQIQPTALQLKTLVKDSFQNFRYLDGWDKVGLRVEVNAEIPFYNDLFRVSIILNNLIANAIKFRNPEVAHSFVSFRIEVDESKATLYINDNGTGIAPSSIPQIFDMFYRGSEISTGSGLGLYIVKQALQKTGGQIQVESTLGIGTMFTLTLPNYAPRD